MIERRAQHIPLLVTGADGRVGRLLQAAWSGQGPDGIAPLWCGRRYGHWRDLLAGPLDPATTGAVVLHLAGDLSGGPNAAARSVAMARAVAIAARRGRARRIFLASSAAVYAPSDQDLPETAHCVPPTVYGQAKLAAEAACRVAAGHVPVTCLRIGNVVGAGALIGPLRPAGMIELDPVPGQPGGPIRSWIAPEDLARVLAWLVTHAEGLPDVLNLASPGPWTMADMLDAAGYPWVYGPFRDRVLPRLTLDTTRLGSLCPMLRPATPATVIADLRRTLSRRVLA